MKKPHDDWLYFAGEDLAFARAGLKEGFYSHVCALAQQATEKAMKAYLVFQKKPYPKSHGLLRLLELMDVEWLDSHRIHLKKLSDFYIPTRYPDAIAGSLPDGLPDREAATKALHWAEEIVELISSKLR